MSTIVITQQEAFDAVAAWLTRPGAERCAIPKNPDHEEEPVEHFDPDDVEVACVYYDEATGNRCAIGALLSFGTAKALVGEGIGGVSDLIHRGNAPWKNEVAAQAVSELDGLEEDFLRDLQAIHDSNPLFYGHSQYDPQKEKGLTWQQVIPLRLAYVASVYGLNYSG